MKKYTFLFLLFVSLNSHSQTDKLLHASAGYVSASLTTAFLEHFNVKHSVLIGFSVGTCLGIGKELFDKYAGNGYADPLDALFTLNGAALGSVTIKIGLNSTQKKRPKSFPDETSIAFN